MVSDLPIDMGKNCILIINEQTQLMSWDGAAEDFFGLSKKHIGISVIEIIPELKSQLLQYQDQKSFEPELTILRGDYAGRYSLSISEYGDSVEDNQTFFVVLRKLSKSSDRVDAVLEIETHYREQMDLSPETIAIHREGKIVYVNPATLELMGAKSADDALNLSVIDYIAPEYRKLALERIKLNERGEQTPVVREKFIRLDGKEIDVEVMAIPTLFEGKPATKVFFTDITEREKLSEQSRLQSLALTSVANGIVITDPDGVILWANPALLTETGYALDELVGKTPSVFKSGVQDGNFYSEMWQTILKGEVWHGELVNKRKDGSLFTEEMTLTPLLNEAREVTHFIAIKQDITARSEASRKLRESEDKLRGFVEHSADAIRLLDEEGVVILWNPANAKINGILPEHALGKKLIDLLRGFENKEEIEREFSGGFDKFEALLARFFETGVLAEEIASPDYKVPQPDGSEKHVQASYFTIETDKGFMIGSVLRDVTEQEVLEEALWESDSRYQTLYNQSNDGVIILDLEGIIIAANDRAKEIYGGDFIGLHPDDIVGTDEDISSQGPIQRIRAGEHVPVFERQYIRADGTVGVVELNINLVHDKTGAPQYLLAVAHDITEKKRIENELRIGDLRYKALFERSSDAVFIFDMDLLIVAVNHRASEFMGYEIEEMIGKQAEDMVAPGEAGKADQKASVVFAGDIVEPYERVFICKDGTRKIGEINLSVIYDDDEEPAFLQSIVRDVTEKKKVENALKTSDSRYKALFERSSDAIFIIDRDYRIVTANQRAGDLVGYEVEEMVGMDGHEFSVQEERGQALQKANIAVLGEIIDPYERNLIRKDGTRLVVEINLSVIYDAEGEPVFLQSIMRDITHKKDLEKQLHFRATHDTLTGLPNRALLYDHLREQMKQAEDDDTLLGVVFIDLDGFKAVNDTFDHARGDMFLVEIANRFKLVLGENDFVSRMGGDEFVFVLAGYAAKDTIQTAVDELLNWIERPYQGIPDSMKISASIGVSVYPGDADNDEGLIQAADKAMYHIKKHGKNGVRFYEEIRG